jgi:hypothetical protein
MYIVYKLNSHDGTYVAIGEDNDFEKAAALAKELSKWSTPYCNEVGRAKVTQNLGFDVCHYEDGHELEMLKNND